MLFIFLVSMVAMPLAPTASAASPWHTGNPSLVDATRSVSKDEFDKIAHEQTALLGKLNCHNRRIARRAFGSLNIQFENACWYQTKIGLLSAKGDYLLQPGTDVAGHLDFTDHLEHTILPTPNEDVFLDLIPASASGYGSYVGFRHIDDMAVERTTNTTGTVSLKLTNPITYRPRAGSSSGAMLNLATTRLSWSADGKYLLAWSNRGILYMFNLETFTTQAIQVWGYYGSPMIGTVGVSPSGRYVATTREQHINTSNLYITDIASCKNPGQRYYVVDTSCSIKELRNLLIDEIPGFRMPTVPRFYGEHTLGFYHRNGAGDDYTQYFLQAAGTEFSTNGYLALGDSFSAGEGAGDYIDGTDINGVNMCHTSHNSYPYLINMQLDFTDFLSVACSGARIHNFWELSQYPDTGSENHPGSTTQKVVSRNSIGNTVTITMSGNDIGFKDRLEYCLLQASFCYDSYEKRGEIAKEISDLHPRLIEMYKAILDKPSRRLYVIGYPQIVSNAPEVACGVNVQLNTYQRQMAHDLIVYLNAVIKSAAVHAGAFYVDTQEAFAGHKLCEGPSATLAINGITLGNDTGIWKLRFINNDSFHPNHLGYELLATTIIEQTDGLSAPMPAADTSIPIPHAYDFPFMAYEKQDGTMRKLIRNRSERTFAQRGKDAIINTLKNPHPLRPFEIYNVWLRSSPIFLGQVTTDGAGFIDTTLAIPDSVTPGLHELRIEGLDENGEEVALYEFIYIAASPDDFDGDGTPNKDEPCGIIKPAHRDEDGDGVDDACDPFIAIKAADESPPPLPNGRDGVTNIDDFIAAQTTSDPTIQPTTSLAEQYPHTQDALSGEINSNPTAAQPSINQQPKPSRTVSMNSRKLFTVASVGITILAILGYSLFSYAKKQN